MKQILIDLFLANLHLKQSETLDNADIAFLCSISKITEIKSRYLK
jgi:hypothetical protein